MSKSQRKPPARRAQFKHFTVIPTRWMDNDVYGHVNNVVYYSYFDTVVNRYLIDFCGLDYHSGETIGVVVETSCRFHRSFCFPEDIEAGLRVAHIGNSSVNYEIGLFGVGEDEARADGYFVHVYVDRATRRPTPIPDYMRAGLVRLVDD